MMLTSEQELKKIAALAYIDTNVESTQQLAHDVSAIMTFVQKLREIDTTNVTPLLHPLDLHQRLRLDEVKEVSQVAELERMAPLFADGLYLVPKVIDSGK